jgi:hypothetical protein
MTPKFIRIAIAKAQYGDTIIGLTADGDVYEWKHFTGNKSRWVKLENEDE